MKKLLSLLLLVCSFQGILLPAAVTYRLNGGRFGDQLVVYTHARWAAYICDVPLFFVPFDQSDKLMVSKLYTKKKGSFNETVVFPKKGDKVDLLSLIDRSQNTLYKLPFFPESPDQIARQNYWHFDVDWKDAAFLKIIRHELSPLEPVQKLNLPHDRITVAIHMRKGGGFKEDQLLQDTKVIDPNVNYADVIAPLRFPPLDYYVDQLVKISTLLNDQPLYVHIFTDDRNPQELTEKVKQAVNKPNILFGSRESDNRHDANVLDDFFALTHFDCLIRSESHFSSMASKLADYKIHIYPKSYKWEGTKLSITDVSIEQN